MMIKISDDYCVAADQIATISVNTSTNAVVVGLKNRGRYYAPPKDAPSPLELDRLIAEINRALGVTL